MKSVCALRECPDCASGNVVCDDAREQLICKDCGLIFEPLVPEEEENFEKTHNIVLAEKKSKSKKAAKKSASKKKKK